MTKNLKLMCIFAHPDDETFSTGGILARYAAEGVETTLVCATRGERGWIGSEEEYPGLEALGKMREAELRCAAQVLGIRKLIFLDYIDGKLDKAPPLEVISKIASAVRRVRPQVVVTMDPQGVYGHPDHMVLTQFTLAALLDAASPSTPGEMPPHAVSKLYMVAETQEILDGYARALGGTIGTEVDGVERIATGWPEWAVSAVIDTCAYWPQVLQAFACHRTQVPDLEPLASMPVNSSPAVWGLRTYYRAFSLVNSGPERENDLFAGLREE